MAKKPRAKPASLQTTGRSMSQAATKDDTEVGGIAADRLRSIIERVERLEEEKKALSSDIKDIMAEAKSAGFDVKVIRQIIEHERNARKFLLKSEMQKIEDTIWRAYGLLSYGRVMESKEAVELLSMLRMGINLGIVDNIDQKTINELFVLIQPAHLQILSGEPLSPPQRDELRARIIRERLAGKTGK